MNTFKHCIIYMDIQSSPANLGRHRYPLIFFPYVLRETRLNPLSTFRIVCLSSGISGGSSCHSYLWAIYTLGKYVSQNLETLAK